VNLEEVVLSRPPPQLPHRFNEWHALNVADCATKLDDAHVGRFVGIIDRDACDALDPVLYCIGDVRYDLYSLA